MANLGFTNMTWYDPGKYVDEDDDRSGAVDDYGDGYYVTRHDRKDEDGFPWWILVLAGGTFYLLNQ